MTISKEKKKEYDRLRYPSIRDKRLQYAKDNYNPEYKREYDKRYRETNQHRIRQAKHEYMV